MPGSREVLDSWGNAKWKEGQAAPASAEETTQLLKGECEGLEWNELSCRIYHSDSEIKGVRLLSCFESQSPSLRVAQGFAAAEKRERGPSKGEARRGGVGPNGEARSAWKPAWVWGEPIQIASQPATNLLSESAQVSSPSGSAKRSEGYQKVPLRAA